MSGIPLSVMAQSCFDQAEPFWQYILLLTNSSSHGCNLKLIQFDPYKLNYVGKTKNHRGTTRLLIVRF